MLKCNSDNFSSATKLVDALQISTKEDLKDIADLLNISILSKLRKQEYAIALTDAILTHPEKWLNRLTAYELALLQKLVNAGPNTYVEEPDVLVESSLEAFSFIITDREAVREGSVRYMIFNELREAVAPHLDKILTSEDRKMQFEIEQYAIGLVNLYGMLPMGEILNMLEEYLGDYVSRQDIFIHLSKSLLIQRQEFEMEDVDSAEIYVQSPLLDDPEELDDMLLQHTEIGVRKYFVRTEVFQAGEMPIPHIPCIRSKGLSNFMINHLGYNESEAHYHLQNLWLNIQMDTHPMSVVTSFIDGQLSTMLELQECIEEFMFYCNQCPRWFLKGHSASEIAEYLEEDGEEQSQKSPSQLVAELNLKAQGIGITPEIGMDFNDTISTSKVGRNELCPCGSGKKYKKCCGGN